MMPTKGNKQEKVRAAFEYADYFLEEDAKFERGEYNREVESVRQNASENRSGLFGFGRKSNRGSEEAPSNK
jgi:hypothetical protein